MIRRRIAAGLLLLTGGATAIANESWVPFEPGEGPYNPEISVLSSGTDGVSFELSIPGMWVMDREEGGETYQRLRLPSGGRTADLGLPELPYVGRFIGVPHGASVTAQITVLDSITLSGSLVWPAQEPVPDLDGVTVPFHRDETFYNGTASFPERSLGVSGTRVVRGLETVLVGIFPFSYAPLAQELTVHRRVRVDIEFTGGSGYFVESRLRSRFFEPLYAGMVLNYDSVAEPSVLPSLREDEAEMIIIVPDGLVSGIAPLAEWRTISGLKTRVVSLSEAGGNADGIAQFIEDAYTGWEIPPSFVLLVGDSDLMPTNYRYIHPYHGSLTGTDLWYFTVDGDDEFADIHHGRISVEGEAGLAILNKMLAYEREPQGGAWNNHVFLAAYEEYGRYFTIVSDMIYDYLTSIGYDCDRAYEGGTPPGGTADVIANFNNGSFIVNHRDHGDTDGWSHPSFTISHLPQLNNGTLLPVVYSLNCLTGYFDAETDQSGGTFESFCEEILRKSSGGAVGVIGATRVSYSGYNDELVKGVYDAMWPDFDPGYPGGGSANPWISPTYCQGAVLDFAKWWMYDKYVLTGGAGYPWGPDASSTRVEMEMFHYHGDPSFQIHTAEPTAIVVSHDAATVVGVPSFTVYADCDGGMVALSVEGELLGRALVTDGVAQVVFAEPPTVPGTMTVVVTGHNRIPYEGTVEVAPATGWYVVVDSVMADDYAGYPDGIIDQGDSLNLSIRLWNVGSQTAPDVTGTLSCGDPSVTVEEAVQVYGSIVPDGIGENGESYRVSVLGGVPDGHAVTFQLAVDSAESSWVRPFSLQIHGPVFIYAAAQIDDSAGNGNGRPDPGEVIQLTVDVMNSGSGTASSVQAELVSNNDDALVLVAQGAYPDILPDHVESNAAAYTVAFDAGCPEGTIIPFTLHLQGFGPVQAEIPFSLVVGLRPLLFVDTDDETHEQRLVDALNALGTDYQRWDVPPLRIRII